MVNILKEDLDHIMAHTEGLWEDFRGKRIFLTGGTGFFGCWLLESLLWANDKLGLNVGITVLTRAPEAFKQKAPHLAGHAAVRLLAGDVRTFEFPAEPFSYVIHAAAEADTAMNRADPPGTLDTIVTGTRRVLELTATLSPGVLLLVSSGAVYGQQPGSMARIPEDYVGAPDSLQPASAYGEGKRVAELMAVMSSRRTGWQMKIARGFAFLGPYLPLDRSFAAGNFVRDVLRNGPVIITGDGTACRSYLYGADLAIWLWTILVKGLPERAYNVGSEHEVSMADLAKHVVLASGKNCPVTIAHKPVPGIPPMRYVPDIHRARQELGLAEYITLDEAAGKMLRYCTNIK